MSHFSIRIGIDFYGITLTIDSKYGNKLYINFGKYVWVVSRKIDIKRYIHEIL